MAISGHAGIGLDVFRHGYCHKSIDNTVEETEACICSSLLEGVMMALETMIWSLPNVLY